MDPYKIDWKKVNATDFPYTIRQYKHIFHLLPDFLLIQVKICLIVVNPRISFLLCIG